MKKIDNELTKNVAAATEQTITTKATMASELEFSLSSFDL